MNHELLAVPTMAEMAAAGKQPEILFWVGCAGSFDERAQKITRDICKILYHVGIRFAVLGTEESCTGDPAKRAPEIDQSTVLRTESTSAQAGTAVRSAQGRRIDLGLESSHGDIG